MTTTALRLLIEKEMAPHTGKRFVCPDDQVLRTLVGVQCGKNDVTAVCFEGGYFQEYPSADFGATWKLYKPEVDPDAPVSETRIAEVVSSPAIKRLQGQASGLVQTHGLTATLLQQIENVKKDPKAIPQAKTVNELAKQVIEIEKMKLEAIRLVQTLTKES